MDLGRYVVESVRREGRSVSEIAAELGHHRSWVYKLLARYDAEGEAGLAPRSRRPRSSPNQISAEIEDEIVFIRKTLNDAGVDAGAVTIHYHLEKKFENAPSQSTIWRVLRKRGFIEPQPKKRPRSSFISFVADLPNQCWQTDMTHWALSEERGVEILNFIDDHSRFLIASVALSVTKTTDVVRIFHKSAANYGYPASVLTDNGAIFTARYRGGRTGFESELETFGIVAKHSSPYHPQTCGKVERLHQTMKKFLIKKPRADDLEQLQDQLNAFRDYYNEIRPHRSIGRRTPAEAYQSRMKATPSQNTGRVRSYVRHDVVDKTGVVTLRRDGVLHHIGIGRPHKGTRVLMLVSGLNIRVITEEGELLRELVLDTTRDYQAIGDT